MNEVIAGLLTDYVRLLEKEHPTTAKVVQQVANQELAKMSSSSRPVPDDRTQAK